MPQYSFPLELHKLSRIRINILIIRELINPTERPKAKHALPRSIKECDKAADSPALDPGAVKAELPAVMGSCDLHGALFGHLIEGGLLGDLVLLVLEDCVGREEAVGLLEYSCRAGEGRF